MDTSPGTWRPARRKAPSTPWALRSLPAMMAVGRSPPVVCMSGLPAPPGDPTPNWITTCWPPEPTEILRAQWDIAIPYWRDLGAFARQQNVQLALEMHANQLVYHAPTG